MNEHRENLLRPQTRIQQVVCALIPALFFVRYFIVAESAVFGDSLWVVALWLLLLLTWLIASWRSTNLRPAPGWLDIGVLLLAGGHLISAGFVLATIGEKRSAINLAWEWIGVLICWFLLRHACSRSAFRHKIPVGLIAVGASVSGLGLFQHYVDFPQLAAKYGPLIDQLRVAGPSEAAGIRQTLAEAQIPTEGSALTLFDKRLRDSREPLGLFALANTFGGFLGVCLILSVSAVTAVISRRPSNGAWDWRRIGPLILMIVLMGWCLLLTKSRTAWIGTAVGLTFFWLCRRQPNVIRLRMAWFGTALVLLVLVGWGLSALGGLDWQIVSEAPKSLLYRMQYWSATLPMIKDHFLLGVGPGQFRHQYLLYKRPEASEEIADPHNLFLDVAVNGGLLALVGLLMLCVGLFQKPPSPDDKGIPDSGSKGDRLILSTVSAAVVLAWLVLLVTGQDDRLLVLLPISVALFWILNWICGSAPDNDHVIQIGSQSAALALLVHLLGAGGIGMPAVTLLLLALISLSRPVAEMSPQVVLSEKSTSDRSAGAINQPRKHLETDVGLSPKPAIMPKIVLGLVGVAGAIALYTTAIRPVTLTQMKMTEGDRLSLRGKTKLAEAQYRQAALADPLSADPWRREAQIAFLRAKDDLFRSNDSFLNAVHLMREAEKRDPANPRDDQTLGDWWLSRWRVTSKLDDAREAESAYERALFRYPTSAILMANSAFALEATGQNQAAGGIASKALTQDDLNHQKGHVDRYLSDPIRLHLETLAHAASGH